MRLKVFTFLLYLQINIQKRRSQKGTKKHSKALKGHKCFKTQNPLQIHPQKQTLPQIKQTKNA